MPPTLEEIRKHYFGKLPGVTREVRGHIVRLFEEVDSLNAKLDLLQKKDPPSKTCPHGYFVLNNCAVCCDDW